MAFKKGEPATGKRAAAGRKNLERGRAARQKQREAAKGMDFPTATARWRMLLSGTITVRDLDDEELERGRVRGKDGGFSGRGPAVPSHILQQITAERRRRSLERLESFGPAAAQILIDLGQDPNIDASNRRASAQYILDRLLGKTPETVHVKADDLWGAMLDGAFVVDRDLSDLE